QPGPGQPITGRGGGHFAVTPEDVHDFQFSFREITSRRTCHRRLLLEDNWFLACERMRLEVGLIRFGLPNIAVERDVSTPVIPRVALPMQRFCQSPYGLRPDARFAVAELGDVADKR